VVWIVGAVAASRLLPGLSTVTQSSSAQFLPANAPSQQAAKLAAPFQTTNVGATALLVASRSDGGLTAADQAAIAQVEQSVAQLPDVLTVRDQGLSADGQARRALVVTGSNGGNAGNPSLVGQIRDAFATESQSGLSFHLTGPLAQTTDAAASGSQTGTNIRVFSVLFVVVLLFVVYRAVLAPLVTLLPAVVSLLLAGPLITGASRIGLPVSVATQTLLPVLLIGAGTDYGLFLVFRVREEIRRGASHKDAVVIAMERVGLSISYSALTVIVALACLVLASFTLYQGLGPSLALGIAVMLVAALTLLPALLAIFGRVLYWPSHPTAGQPTTGAWGRLAARVIRQPVAVLLGGLILFAALAAGITGFRAGGFTSPAPSGTDSAAGDAVIASHFPTATRNPETLLLRFETSIWNHPQSLDRVQERLSISPQLRSLAGPLDPNGTTLTSEQLVNLHSELGPAQSLPPSPADGSVPLSLYEAYRSTAQFISTDGLTIEFLAQLSGGPAGSQAAIDAIRLCAPRWRPQP
jgi:RND superfamily putative drug exporter